MSGEEFSDQEKAIIERIIAVLGDTPPEIGLDMLAAIIVGTVNTCYCAEHAPERLSGISEHMREGLQELISGAAIQMKLDKATLS